MGGSLGESRCCSQISPRISALSDPQVTYKRHSTKLNECLPPLVRNMILVNRLALTCFCVGS